MSEFNHFWATEMKASFLALDKIPTLISPSIDVNASIEWGGSVFNSFCGIFTTCIRRFEEIRIDERKAFHFEFVVDGRKGDICEFFTSNNNPWIRVAEITFDGTYLFLVKSFLHVDPPLIVEMRGSTPQPTSTLMLAGSTQRDTDHAIAYFKKQSATGSTVSFDVIPQVVVSWLSWNVKAETIAPLSSINIILHMERSDMLERLGLCNWANFIHVTSVIVPLGKWNPKAVNTNKGVIRPS